MSSQIATMRPAQILLAEDNENDAELTRIGFTRSRLLFDLHWVRDGEECMTFLRKQGRYAAAPTPDMLLLDLKMPRMDGREVLAAMLEDEALRSIPVVVMTTSQDEQEVFEMYNLRCNSYIVKPIELQEFLRVAELIVDYWFALVVLPGRYTKKPLAGAGA